MDDDTRLEKISRLEARMDAVESGLSSVMDEQRDMQRELHNAALETRGMSGQIGAILDKLEEMSKRKLRTVDVILSLGMLAIAIMTYLK